MSNLSRHARERGGEIRRDNILAENRNAPIQPPHVPDARSVHARQAFERTSRLLSRRTQFMGGLNQRQPVFGGGPAFRCDSPRFAVNVLNGEPAFWQGASFLQVLEGRPTQPCFLFLQRLPQLNPPRAVDQPV